MLASYRRTALASAVLLAGLSVGLGGAASATPAAPAAQAAPSGSAGRAAVDVAGTSAAPVLGTTWYFRDQTIVAGQLVPPSDPTVPAADLAVAGPADQNSAPEKETFVAVDPTGLPAGARLTALVISLQLDGATTQGFPSGMPPALVAVPATRGFTAGPGPQPGVARPSVDAAAPVEGVYDAAATSYRFDVTALGARWLADPETNLGVGIRLKDGTSLAQVVFVAQTASGKATYTAPSPDGGSPGSSAAPAAPTAPTAAAPNPRASTAATTAATTAAAAVASSAAVAVPSVAVAAPQTAGVPDTATAVSLPAAVPAPQAAPPAAAAPVLGATPGAATAPAPALATGVAPALTNSVPLRRVALRGPATGPSAGAITLASLFFVLLLVLARLVIAAPAPPPAARRPRGLQQVLLAASPAAAAARPRPPPVRRGSVLQRLVSSPRP